jgi:2'-5' RNA ligase
MSRIRTFLAVDLAKPIRERIVALQEELAQTGIEIKWTEPENLHVTLVFLGEVADREVPRVCSIASEAVQGRSPFRLMVETVGCFPNPRRPRIVWVGTGQGKQELVQIHDALEPPLFELGYRREERRYAPHITLGRVKGDRPSERLAATLAKHSGWQGGEMIAQEICVMGSELTPTGPVYTVLGRAQLGQ